MVVKSERDSEVNWDELQEGIGMNCRRGLSGSGPRNWASETGGFKGVGQGGPRCRLSGGKSPPVGFSKDLEGPRSEEQS